MLHKMERLKPTLAYFSNLSYKLHTISHFTSMKRQIPTIPTIENIIANKAEVALQQPPQRLGIADKSVHPSPLSPEAQALFEQEKPQIEGDARRRLNQALRIH